jgi:hypothetical protein
MTTTSAINAPLLPFAFSAWCSKWCGGVVGLPRVLATVNHPTMPAPTHSPRHPLTHPPTHSCTMHASTQKCSADDFFRPVGSDGVWRQRLPPTDASETRYTITASSSSGKTQSLTDVLFGDVYICGGQSNMDFGITLMENYTQELALANNSRFSTIRLFTVGVKTQSPGVPLNWLHTLQQPWTTLNATTLARGGDWGGFSAVCWVFGRTVHDGLQNKVTMLYTRPWHALLAHRAHSRRHEHSHHVHMFLPHYHRPHTHTHTHTHTQVAASDRTCCSQCLNHRVRTLPPLARPPVVSSKGPTRSRGGQLGRDVCDHVGN